MTRVSVFAVLGLLAALAVAAPARAGDTKLLCTLTAGADLEEKGAPGGVRLIGGHGDFNADVQVICAGVSKGESLLVRIDFTSEGTYDTVVCGTGVAVSAPGDSKVTNIETLLTTTKVNFDPVIQSLAYRLEFAGSKGTVHTNLGGSLGKGFPSVSVLENDKGSNPSTPYLSGAVSIDPVSTTTPDIANGECQNHVWLEGVIKVEV